MSIGLGAGRAPGEAERIFVDRPQAHHNHAYGRRDHPADAISSILGAVAVDVGARMAGTRPVTDETILDRVAASLSVAQWPTVGYRVRRDRDPARAGRAGAWRFDLVVERPDRVVAVIDARAGGDDLERQVLALSRLSLARSRGIAETAYLFAAEPAPSGALPGCPGTSRGTPPGSSPSPIAEVEFTARGGAQWRLRLFEAAQAAD